MNKKQNYLKILKGHQGKDFAQIIMDATKRCNVTNRYVIDADILTKDSLEEIFSVLKVNINTDKTYDIYLELLSAYKEISIYTVFAALELAIIKGNQEMSSVQRTAFQSTFFFLLGFIHVKFKQDFTYIAVHFIQDKNFRIVIEQHINAITSKSNADELSVFWRIFHYNLFDPRTMDFDYEKIEEGVEQFSEM
jgi:hypothetical protein